MKQTNKTIITNHKQVKIVYFMNEKGYTTSILEGNNGDLNDLRSLEKLAGIQMIGNGEDSEKINQQNSHLLTTNTIFTKDNLFSNFFSGIKEFRKNKCPDYINYVCSFWLKLNQNISNSKIELIIYSKNYADRALVTLDNSAINSWQFISFPIKIQNDEINSIQMKFLENNVQKSVKIADMRLNYTTTNIFYLTNIEIKDSLDQITKVKYVKSNASLQEKKSIDELFYLTETDIRATYLNYFKVNGNTASGNPFILSCCNGTLKIDVSSVTFYTSINNYSIGFYTDEFSSGTRAQFKSEIQSPDGKLFTYGITHFIKNQAFPQKTCDCLYQVTQAYKSGSNPITSDQEMYMDLKGNVLFEKDEYGIRKFYEYDNVGNLSKKILVHKVINEKKLTYVDAEELIISTSETDSWRSNEKDIFNTNQTFYSNPNGLIEKTSFNGLNEDQNQALITDYKYNLLQDKCTSIENNNQGKNLMRYDQRNRLVETSPMNWNDPNFYGFKFQYNSLNDPNKYYSIYKNGSQIAQDLLVEKIINYSNNTIQTKQYRNDDSPDWTTVYLDKYDRTYKIEDESKITTFTRQNILESQMASEVVEMIDPYNNQIYQYSYDDSNNVTSYGIKTTNGKNWVSYSMPSENKTSCQLSNGILREVINAAIIYTENQLIEPRINFVKQNSMIEQQFSYILNTAYDYDNLGRIAKESHQFKDVIGNNYFVKEYNYKKNTFMFETIKTKIINAIISDTIYDFSYDYDQRGNLKKETMSKTRGSNSNTLTREYTYDRSSRLLSELGGPGYALKSYTYNQDGSLNQEIIGSNLKKFEYSKGRLSSISYLNEKTLFEYDNLGNCLKYKMNSSDYLQLSWERGNLLKKVEGNGLVANYFYNNQGVRYKKELSNGESSTYYLDG